MVTRAAVSRALARSRTGRDSVKSYFCMPARSACPGRGRVSGALRANSASNAGSIGSEAMTCSHFGHSVLPTMIAIGEPSVLPCRTPARIVTSSASNFMRAPRPAPSRRLARACEMSSDVTLTPAGKPSSVATRARPCDSPAVRYRSMCSSIPDRQVRSARSPPWSVRLGVIPTRVHGRLAHPQRSEFARHHDWNSATFSSCPAPSEANFVSPESGLTATK